MALWTMTPDGTWLLVVPAHRAYAAAMTEDEPLSGEQAERLKAALRKMDAKMGHAVHYGPGEVPLCRAEPVRALWTDELEAVAGCDDCLELVAEDLTDENDYQGRCLHRQGRGPVAQGSPCPHCGKQGW